MSTDAFLLDREQRRRVKTLGQISNMLGRNKTQDLLIETDIAIARIQNAKTDLEMYVRYF